MPTDGAQRHTILDDPIKRKWFEVERDRWRTDKSRPRYVQRRRKNKAKRYDWKPKKQRKRKKHRQAQEPQPSKFWHLIGEFHGLIDKADNAERRLELLQRWADIKLCGKIRGKRLRMARTEFGKIAWKILPNVSQRPCLVCLQPADQRHHVIQLQHGGLNVAANIVPICEPCHEWVHPWMAERRQQNQEC